MATQNKGKLAEIRDLLKDFGFELSSMAEAGLGELDIEENGADCRENSIIKAKAVMELTGLPAIADDAGLFVDALGGEPGVLSARYAGKHGDDAANRKKLLHELKLRGAETKTERSAYFICVITLMYPDERAEICEGRCPGSIALEEKGDQGFGYDSIFIPQGYEQSFAELGEEIKNKLSHRAKALAELRTRSL